MSCSFLKGNLYKVCMAYDDIMVVSSEELEGFCTSSHFELCPIFQRFQRDDLGARVAPNEEYKYFAK